MEQVDFEKHFDDLAASEESVGICDGGCIPAGSLSTGRSFGAIFYPYDTEISTATSRLPA